MGLEERVFLQQAKPAEDVRRKISDLYVFSQYLIVGHIAIINTKERADKGVDQNGRLVLGNHYHEAKEFEVFRLNHGSAEVILEDIGTKERLVKPMVRGDMIQVPRRV